MIQVSGTFQNVERLYAMALCAILPELVFMHILMTGGAIVMLYPFINFKFSSVSQFSTMAKYTLNLYVFSTQGKFSFFMIESACRDELIKIMAIRALA